MKKIFDKTQVRNTLYFQYPEFGRFLFLLIFGTGKRASVIELLLTRLLLINSLCSRCQKVGKSLFQNTAVSWEVETVL